MTRIYEDACSQFNLDCENLITDDEDRIIGCYPANSQVTLTLSGSQTISANHTFSGININETFDRIAELENKVKKLEKLLEKYGIDIEQAEKCDLSE